MLSEDALENPVVSKALGVLKKERPFSAVFDTVKDKLKEHIMEMEGVNPALWGNDWAVEDAIMTYLFGQGHA